MFPITNFTKMSKQINFFITREDLAEIESFLKKENCLFIVQPIFNLDNMFQDTIIFDGNNKSRDTVLLAPNFRENQIKINKIDQQGYFLVNNRFSDIVEFSRGIYSDNANELKRGRLFYDTGYYEVDGTFLKKSNDFMTWADGLVARFKKQFLKKTEWGSSVYFSINAIDWIEKNKIKVAIGDITIKR